MLVVSSEDPLLSRPDPETLTIVQVARLYRPPGWWNLFQQQDSILEEITSTLIGIKASITDGSGFAPLNRDIFAAFHAVPLNLVRVVIIGQDPYHSSNHGSPIAIGRSFSVRRGTAIPPSLLNIYKEIKLEYPEFKIPSHGDLSSWERQGVFLLNAALTVTLGQAGSHGQFGFWLQFIKPVLEAINAVRPNCIYLLWGKDAQKLQSNKLISGKAICLVSAHPSPMAAHRGFFGNNHFRQVNEHLSRLGETSIDWSIPD